MIAFKPVALRRALERVRRQHPRQGRGERELTDALLDRLRALLRETPVEGLRRLAEELRTEEVRGCFRIAVVDREGSVAEKAARIVGLRPRPAYLNEGWRLLCREYPHPLLETLVRGLVSVFGREGLAKELGDRSWTLGWLENPDLGEGLLAHYERSMEPSMAGKGMDAYLDSAAVESSHGLFVEGWRQLLSRGSRAALQREAPSRVLEQLTSPSWRATDRAVFGQHYLVELRHLENWFEPVLQWIRERFGDPASTGGKGRHEDPFWHPVPDPVKAEFRRWTLRRRIETFFEGERAQFWRTYVDENRVRDVREILDGQGFMLDFGDFGVVEFKEIGNAAYVYPSAVFRRYWMRAEELVSPGMFKDRDRTLPTWRWNGVDDGRILHHDGWQEKARERLTRHLGRTA